MPPVSRGKAFASIPEEIQKQLDTPFVRFVPEQDVFRNGVSANIAPLFGFFIAIRFKLGVELLVAIGRPATKRNPKSKSQTRVNK